MCCKLASKCHFYHRVCWGVLLAGFNLLIKDAQSFEHKVGSKLLSIYFHKLFFIFTHYMQRIYTIIKTAEKGTQNKHELLKV